MYKFFLFFSINICLSSFLKAQILTIEDIFLHHKYDAKNLEDFNFYEKDKFTVIENSDEPGVQNVVIKDFFNTNKKILIDGIRIKTDLQLKNVIINKMTYFDSDNYILSLNGESLYRRSAMYQYCLYNINTNKVEWISQQKVKYLDFSPDLRFVSFVLNENLFLYELKTKKLKPITKNGAFNMLQYGSADWMYEEEFYMTKAYEWSDDGSKIAFLSFDLKDIKEFNFTTYNQNNYPTINTIKYPKAGENIAKVNLNVYTLKTKKTKTLDIPKDYYTPKIFWKNNDEIAYLYMPRIQNELKVNTWNLKEINTIYSENSKTFIEIPLITAFIDEDKLLITSFKDGNRHFYAIQKDSICQLTEGDYNITDFYSYNTQNNTLLYQSSEKGITEKAIYYLDIKTKAKTCITPLSGCYSIKKIGRNQNLIEYSNINQPPILYLADQFGNNTKTILTNDTSLLNVAEPIHIFDIKTEEYSLPAYHILPPNFNATQKYPLLIYCYGGPHRESVLNKWPKDMLMWLHFMAQQGYIVACVDNRGVGNQSLKNNTSIYGKLGTNEVEDQALLANYMIQNYNIDTSNVSIWGWSYGGYLAIKCLLDSTTIFKKAVAIAPVTDWRFYDAAYVERYMNMPQINNSGYQKSSLITNASKLKGKLLLIHGTADDNVHFQNSLEFIRALQIEGKKFEIMIYPDKFHSIAGTQSRYHLFKTISEFIFEP